MGSRDQNGPGDGTEMRFLDEVEAEAELVARLGRGEGQVYDEGYGPTDADDGLLEFTDDGIPAAAEDDEEEHSEPVRIFVGRTAVPAGPTTADAVGPESASGPIAAVSIDDDDDDDDDEFDEFEDAPPVQLRAPDNAPGMRLLTPEREESLDTDRAWPGLARSPAASREPPRDRPSWLDSLPPVRPRVDAAEPDPGAEGEGAGRAWDAPLLEFGSEPAPRAPAWSLEDDEDEQAAIAAGDEEDVSLPVHEPLSFGDDLYAYDDEPLAAEEPDEAEPVDEDAADTGSWNRLAVMASAEVAEQEQSRFGVAPAPVWRAEDPGAELDDGDGASIPWEEQASGSPWGDADHWSDAPGGAPPSPDTDSDAGPALPPIQPMASVLQAELNARTPVEPKAVVLKTLDGVRQSPLAAGDEPSELRSRVPGADDTVAAYSQTHSGRSGRVQAQTAPEPTDSEGGGGRLLLVVAITLIITVGAIWQWRSTLFTEQEAIPLAVDPPAVTVDDGPELVAGAEPSTAVASGGGAPEARVPDAPPADRDAAAGGGSDAPTPDVPPTEPPTATRPTAEEQAEVREAARQERRDALQTGLLLVRTDTAATVYVDGKKVGTAPMALPGIELKPGHHDIRVVPQRSGRTYRTTTRVDAGRVRNIEVTFLK